ncbi:hypothetical protein GPECTOR_11g333 [Gonium pectorale]|uniref:Anaphase-promoting complex subunit 4 WD40 domain-containing protein n=1 Tax=Gonium pectorale TaxID=33097 RepID=A0A150GRE5_GONPE|nr:hypothetical protein GPECTOR_11g333 [Gonium pectorale]|eukprot:KXZ51900.1 hypothetical protein GPECTOR_11g333 [Gonium pectorale]
MLVAVGRTEKPPLAVEWIWGGDTPAFASIGSDGLLLWTLQDSFLEQRSVPLSDREPGLPCTALTVDPSGVLLVAEAPEKATASGSNSESHTRVWHIEVADGEEGVSASMVQVAVIPGSSTVTGMAASEHHALVGTDQGTLIRFSLSAEPGMSDVVVATSASTIWFVGMQALAVSPGVGASLAAAGWRDRFVVFPAPWDDPSCTAIAEYDVPLRDGDHELDGDRNSLSPDVPALLAFVGSGTKLLTYSSPLLLGAVLVFDYRLSAVVRRVRIPQMVRSLALSPDGELLLLGTMKRGAFMVHLASGNTEFLDGHTQGPVTAVAFSSDGRYAVTAASSVLMMWDAPTLLRKLKPPPPPPPPRTVWDV